ncbi:hypothetical protein RvY_12549 [Ramazzottius varieornatus]|uniref:Pre-mRNA-splicing factor SPF27 n=1 Tax=Ramazzottius varieornatus TaxID=947166 RepID=A0A1D1VSH9_RAMVA|nr:hypothetical protein RvY_12549 [Ramazzottius varieornatus]
MLSLTGGSLSSSATLVDALPYVDSGYDAPGVREAVTALVEQEMEAMKKYRSSDFYLKQLPPLDLEIFQTDLMKMETKRMDDKIPMEKLDFKKYQNIKPASNRRRDPAAWEECFNRVAVLHNHMTNRLANLQLQNDYGPELWRRYIPTVERQYKQYDQELKDIRNKIQEVNWMRKNTQLKAGEKLNTLETTWVNLVGKNFEIERSCLELEAQISALERMKEEEAASRQAAQQSQTSASEGASSFQPAETNETVIVSPASAAVVEESLPTNLQSSEFDQNVPQLATSASESSEVSI